MFITVADLCSLKNVSRRHNISSNVLFCPKLKDIQFTFLEKAKKLESEIFNCFFL